MDLKWVKVNNYTYEASIDSFLYRMTCDEDVEDFDNTDIEWELELFVNEDSHNSFSCMVIGDIKRAKEHCQDHYDLFTEMYISVMESVIDTI